MFDKNG
jgi:P-type E1-E2 ATPase